MSLWYNEGLEFFAQGNIDWDTYSSVKAALTDAGYTPAAGDTGIAAIAGHQLGTSQTVGTRSSASGVLTGGTVTFTGIASSLTVQNVVVYADNGAGSTKLLFVMTTGVNMPLTTTGADIKCEWNNTDPTGTMATL